MAMGTVAGRASALLGMTAEAEFMCLLLVKPARKRAWRAFMALGAGEESHMLGVIEVDIPIVGLEHFGLSQ